MDRLTAVLIGFVIAILAIAIAIIYFFGFWFLVRLALGLGFLVLAIVFGVLFGILLYAKSKYAIFSLLGLMTSCYAVYECYTWENPIHVLYIIALYISA
ncbi:MAG TPA: GlcNAc transferase, partial [Archaeoglobus profundus]|nr:GlcNAc transferase [Archaeoglobus profundus]